MAITDKDMDRYYLNRFNLYKKDYDKAFLWACKNWYKMLPHAQGMYARSIADQIADTCRIPDPAASDIARSISLSMGI